MRFRRRKLDHGVGGNGERQRVAVIGAGIVGLSHAWSAARRGCDVVLLERDRQACGASIRNFGMVWPIGQPNGPNHRAALRSRELWLQLLEETGFWHRACGSLHVAFRDGELAVLSEFAEVAGGGGGNLEDFAPNAAFFSARSFRGHHYCLVSILENKLSLTMHDLSGALRDSFTLEKTAEKTAIPALASDRGPADAALQ